MRRTPGTQDEHQNWRLKSDVVLEDLGGTTLFNDVAEAQRRERPKLDAFVIRGST